MREDKVSGWTSRHLREEHGCDGLGREVLLLWPAHHPVPGPESQRHPQHRPENSEGDARRRAGHPEEVPRNGDRQRKPACVLLMRV